MKLLTTLLLAALLAGCGKFGWDMDALAWSLATELCASHGGLLAANDKRLSGGDREIAALCMDRTEVSHYYTNDVLKEKRK